MLTLTIEYVPTMLGEMVLLTDDAGRLRALDWTDCAPRLQRLLRRHYGADGTIVTERKQASATRRALEAYLAGDVQAIDGIIVETAGTPFQRQVWAALRKIPAGQTLSYRSLAQAIGRPTAMRAVGAANGANPVGIVVPCHRVVGADFSLTGYGGGVSRKLWLLRHEGVPHFTASDSLIAT